MMARSFVRPCCGLRSALTALALVTLLIMPSSPLHAQISHGTSTPARMGPALDPAARREAMTGRWYGEASMPDGQSLRWITERDPNGTYRTQYLSVKAGGEVEESVEMGQWGLSGGVFFTLQRAWIRNGENHRADPSNVYSADAYDLLSITERTIDYRSAGSGRRFSVRRVSGEFQLRGRGPAGGAHSRLPPSEQKKD